MLLQRTAGHALTEFIEGVYASSGSLLVFLLLLLLSCCHLLLCMCVCVCVCVCVLFEISCVDVCGCVSLHSAPITFMPSHPFELNSDDYDIRRGAGSLAPAYPDRILWVPHPLHTLVRYESLTTGAMRFVVGFCFFFCVHVCVCVCVCE